MKLYEAGAVLLIIGSAVVGPIERAPFVDNPEHRKWAACMEINNKVGTIGSYTEADKVCFLPHSDLEPVAEACTRAMQEIGAVSSGATWFLPDTSPGLTSVLCIPAPAGLAGR